MGVVDDQVTGTQRQRVDALAAAVRHPAHVPGGHAALTGEVGLSQDGEPQQIADETGPQLTAGDRGDTAGKIGVVGETSAEIGIPQQFDQPLSRPMSLSNQQDAPRVRQPALDVSDSLRRVTVIRGSRAQA